MTDDICHTHDRQVRGELNWILEKFPFYYFIVTSILNRQLIYICFIDFIHAFDGPVALMSYACGFLLLASLFFKLRIRFHFPPNWQPPKLSCDGHVEKECDKEKMNREKEKDEIKNWLLSTVKVSKMFYSSRFKWANSFFFFFDWLSELSILDLKISHSNDALEHTNLNNSFHRHKNKNKN